MKKVQITATAFELDSIVYAVNEYDNTIMKGKIDQIEHVINRNLVDSACLSYVIKNENSKGDFRSDVVFENGEQALEYLESIT